MKIKSLGMVLSVWMAAGTVCLAAANPNMGTWKLNENKSKIAKGAAKNTTVVYKSTMMGKVKVTVDGVDGKGKPAHNEWTGKFDGKEYPITGDPNGDMRSYKTVDDHTIVVVVKKAGKTTSTGHLVLAGDGKSRTLTVNGTTPEGKKFKSVAVYDKQ
jgi:hypothetical protein